MGKKNNNKSDYLVQGTILAIASIVVRMIGLVYRVPLANILGNEGNAYYNAAYQIYSILLMISSFGLPLAVSKLVSTQMVMGRARNTLKIFKGSLLFALIIGGVASLATFFFAQGFANILKVPESVYSLRVLAPTLFLMAILGAVRGYFQGLGTMIPTAFSQIIEGIINAVISIIAANIFFSMGVKEGIKQNNDNLGAAYGAAGSTVGTLMGALFGLLFLLFVLFIYRKVIKKQIRKDKTGHEDSYQSIMRSLVYTIVPVVLSTVAYNISDLIDTGIFNNLMAFKGLEYKAQMGIYTGKVRLLMNVPLSIASCLTPSLIPSLTEAIVQKDRRMANQKIHMAQRYTMVITIPCAVGLGVLASPILQMLFGDEGAQINQMGALLMYISCVGIVLFAYSTIQNGILQGMDKLRTPVINAVIALVIHSVFLVVFILAFNWDIYGVAIANNIFALIMCILNTRSIAQSLRYRQEIKKTFLIPIGCSVLMGLAVFGSYKLTYMVIKSNLISTMFSILIGAIVYVVSLLKLKGISEGEIYGLPKGATLVSVCKKLHLL